MEVQADFVEPSTPALSYNNASFWRAEDSGYHTSFTPGSVDSSQICNENLDPAIVQGQICISDQYQVNYDITPDSNKRVSSKYVRSKRILASTQVVSTPASPIVRRGVKRPHQDDADEGIQESMPTPTSMIAGGIQKLKVTDSIRSSHSAYTSSLSSVSSIYSECFESGSSSFYHLNEYAPNWSYPTTPVKKICRTSCKLSPLRRSNKKLNFAIHSLSCESRGIVKHRPNNKVVRTIYFQPDQKVDIISMLYQNACAFPPLMKILSYLSQEDICRFQLVSHQWCQVWELASKAEKEELKSFLKNKRDNQENKNRKLLRKASDNSHSSSLKEVHNVMNAHLEVAPSRSPPCSPRTNKFKKFTKCAQLDQRLQLSCVRCSQPSKVNVEASGEEWVECTSASCSYYFCKYCKCDRHPGKNCFKFDLEGPSPSKRKGNIITISTKKSKKNLYRLMI